MGPSLPELPVLLLHDWFTTSDEDWSELAADLSPRFECHYFPLAGHGERAAEHVHPDQPILDHNLSELLRLVPTFERPVQIVAHGVGAHLALRLAALLPDSVRCLVLICPVLKLERYRWLARLTARAPTWLLPLYLLIVDPLADSGSRFGRVRQRLRALRGFWAGAYLRALLQADEPYVAGIRMPVFIIAGDEDPHGSAATAESLSEKLPGSRLLRYGHLRHSPHREEPALVNSAILHFLQAHQTASGPLRRLGRWLKKLLISGEEARN